MYKLSPFQVVSFICTSFLPLLFWVFPRYAALRGGIDGQWAMLGACLVGLFSALIHGLLNHRFPTVAGDGMLKIVYGNLIGKVIGSLYVPGYLLFTAVSLYSFSTALRAVLPNTPRLATMLVLTLIAVMGAVHGLETIARVASIVYPVTLFLLVSTYTFALAQGSWSSLIPYPTDTWRTMRTVVDLLPMFFGMNLYLMLSPHYDHRGRNDLWMVLLGVGISSALVLLVYVITVRMVGYEGVRMLAHPIDFVMQLVEVKGIVIQRFGVVLIFVLTMFEGSFLANQLWAMSDFVAGTFSVAENNKKWFVFAYALCTLILATVIPNQTVWDAINFRILVPLCWLYIALEPTVKLLLSFARGSAVRAARNTRAPQTG